MSKMSVMLINIGIVTTITSICILLVKNIFKNKMSARMHYYIWGLLLIRLVLIPVIPDSMDFMSKKVINDMQINSAQIHNTDVKVNLNTSAINSKLKTNSVAPIIKKSISIDKGKVLNYIWSAGVISITSYFLFVTLVFYIKLNKINECRDAESLSVLEEYKKKIGIKKKVRLKLYDGTSLITGIINPIILINKDYGKDEIKHVLTHELFHLKNNDTILNFMALILLIVNWYNPVVWISFFTYKKDTEILCDQRVVELLHNKKEYASILVKSVTRISYNMSSLRTCLQGNKSELKERILFMSTLKKSSKLSKILIAIILVTGFCGTLIMPQVKAADYSMASINNKSNDNYNKVKELADTIKYDKNKKTFQFSIPKTKPNGYVWLVHITGHENINGVPGVCHYFEDETYNFKWQDGKTYSYQFKDNPMEDLSFEISLLKQSDLNSEDTESDDGIIVSVDKNGNVAKNKTIIRDKIDEFMGTIQYDNDKKIMKFTVPEKKPEGYKWFIHISGHEQTQNGPVVYHAFEDETYNFKWVDGKDYSYEFKDNPMIETSFDVGLINEKTGDIEGEETVVLNNDGSLYGQN